MLVAGDGAANDEFRTDVAICNDTVVVGALEHDGRGDAAGSAYVFNRSGVS
jgi:hypothetical protein